MALFVFGYKAAKFYIIALKSSYYSHYKMGCVVVTHWLHLFYLVATNPILGSWTLYVSRTLKT